MSIDQARAHRLTRLSRLLVWLSLAGTTAATLLVVYVFAHRSSIGLQPHGPYALALLAILPILPLYYGDRPRAYRVALSVVATLLLAVVVLGSFSIGHLYTPAALFALAGLVFDLLGRREAQHA